jgi:signal peptidase I
MNLSFRKLAAIFFISLLTTSFLPTFGIQIPQVDAQPSASLTGIIRDRGVDTDGDKSFDYLEIGVEVEVVEPGKYCIEARGLRDTNYNYIEIWASNYTYLDPGKHFVNVNFFGPKIYHSEINPREISEISLNSEYYGWLGRLEDVPLSREYSYTEFDALARLTGNFYDRGVDTDGDGGFNYLEIDVEIDVVEPGFYEVHGSGFRDAEYNYVNIWSSGSGYLEAGIQVLTLSFDGPTIYSSGVNPVYVSSISLFEAEGYNQIGQISDVPLSQVYSHTNFDFLAILTGVIHDQGLDTDGDGSFDYLEIGVEINVDEAGTYEVSASGLRDVDGNYIDVWDSESARLDYGLHVVNLGLYGPKIYHSEVDPRYVSEISLYPMVYEDRFGFHERQEILRDTPLSREYSYTEFDSRASFTGSIFDRGVDADGDGSFDYLEVGVEINVTDSGEYEISLWGLIGTHIEEPSTREFTIEAFEYGFDPSTLVVNEGDRVNLRIVNEGNTPHNFIIDELGVESDIINPGDSAVVEFTADKVGQFIYYCSIPEHREQGMWGEIMVERSRYELSISVRDKKSLYLDTGIEVVYFSLYGPTIYASGIDPEKVSSISLYEQGYQHLRTIHDASLSRTYSHTEFDAPLRSIEARFIVYPNGQISVNGVFNYTHLTPPYTGPTIEERTGLTMIDDQLWVSENMTVNISSDYASLFPYNATTLALLGDYSNGTLNLGINSTLILLPRVAKEYPFNATNARLTATYSEDVLNAEIDYTTTLPWSIASKFPFNASDITVVGDYSENVLDGTITIHLLPGIALGDLTDISVGFHGNKTDLSLYGSATVIYGTYAGYEVDAAFVDELLQELKEFFGEGPGSLHNISGGIVQTTKLDIERTELTDPLPGATIELDIAIHGDFLRALVYVMSKGRGEMLLYPLLDEAYSSIKSVSFQMAYTRSSQEASMQLTFAHNLKRLIDYILTAPPRTACYIVMSNSMWPAIWSGDVVLVEEIMDFEDVIANPEDGDVIAFYRAGDSGNVILHRAINKTYVNGTLYFTTKGDNNPSPDPWSVPENLVIGKVTRRIPFLGNVLLYAYSVLRFYPYYYGYPYFYYPHYLYRQNIAFPYLSLLKTLFSSIQSMSMDLSYTSTDKKFDLRLTQVDAIDTILEEISTILPETVPQEKRWIVESLLNTTFASVDSATLSLSYKDSKLDLKVTSITQGDLVAELNYVKSIFFQHLTEEYSRYGMKAPWQTDFLREVDIVDISNFGSNLSVKETSVALSFEGLIISSPIDSLGPTSFKLERLFNLTAESEQTRPFPGRGEELKIILKGGSNITHGVSLSRDPEKVPEPDITGPDNSFMIWKNQSFSEIKDMVFNVFTQSYSVTVFVTDLTGNPIANATVYLYWPNGTLFKSLTTDDFGGTDTILVDYAYMPFGEYNFSATYEGISASSLLIISYTGIYTISLEIKGPQVVSTITNPDLVNLTNPFIVNAIENAAALLEITEISEPAMILIRNVTEPVGVGAPPGTWKVLGNYVEIIVNKTGITVNATIRIYYTPEQLEAMGIDENTLTIYYWNTTLGKWIAVKSQVNTEEHFVWANINHFSLWALMGQRLTPMWAQPMFLVIVIIVVVAIAIVTSLAIIRKRRQTRPVPEPVRTSS